MIEVMKKQRKTLLMYAVGFCLSIILTLIAFGITELHVNSGHIEISHAVLLPALIVLALTQLIVQLFFFLHLGGEKNPRWNLFFFISTFGLILLVFIASLWIMNHLNYNMMPDKSTEFIIKDEGIKY